MIDAGHQAQGNSEPEPIGPGASETKAKVASGTSGCVTGINEYQLTLQVSLKLQAALLYPKISVQPVGNPCRQPLLVALVRHVGVIMRGRTLLFVCMPMVRRTAGKTGF